MIAKPALKQQSSTKDHTLLQCRPRVVSCPESTFEFGIWDVPSLTVKELTVGAVNQIAILAISEEPGPPSDIRSEVGHKRYLYHQLFLPGYLVPAFIRTPPRLDTAGSSNQNNDCVAEHTQLVSQPRLPTAKVIRVD